MLDVLRKGAPIKRPLDPLGPSDGGKVETYFLFRIAIPLISLGK